MGVATAPRSFRSGQGIERPDHVGLTADLPLQQGGAGLGRERRHGCAAGIVVLCFASVARRHCHTHAQTAHRQQRPRSSRRGAPRGGHSAQRAGLAQGLRRCAVRAGRGRTRARPLRGLRSVGLRCAHASSLRLEPFVMWRLRCAVAAIRRGDAAVVPTVGVRRAGHTVSESRLAWVVEEDSNAGRRQRGEF